METVSPGLEVSEHFKTKLRDATTGKLGPLQQHENIVQKSWKI